MPPLSGMRDFSRNTSISRDMLWPSSSECVHLFLKPVESIQRSQLPSFKSHLISSPNRTFRPHGPETAFLEMKQCVDALSSDRLWCNTAGIRSFEPWVPPLRLLLPPFAASTNR